MLTITRFIFQINGWEIVLSGSIIFAAFFFLVFLAFGANRNKRAINIYLISMLSVFEVCDFIWLAYFYPRGEFVNHGLITVMIFLLFPLFCIVLNTLLTIINHANRRIFIKQAEEKNL